MANILPNIFGNILPDLSHSHSRAFLHHFAVQEATISALRKSSRRISSGKKRNRNSYTISPRSSPTTPRNHSSSSSGAAAAALQSLANAQLPPLHDSPVSAGTTSNARHHQGALDAALAAAAAAAAGISTSAAAAAGFGREGGRGSRSSSRAGRGDAFGLGVLAGGVPKHKVGKETPYLNCFSQDGLCCAIFSFL